MIILGVYHSHDAGAAIFNDYELIAATALERPTRVKSDGHRFPVEAIQECLDQAGLRLEKVDVVALPRVDYPRSFYNWRAMLPWPLPRRADGQLELMRAMSIRGEPEPGRLINIRDYLAQFGLGHALPFFYNHHLAHALGTLFHTDWNDALLYTSDGGGDRVMYSARHLQNGTLRELFGGDIDSMARQRPQTRHDSVGNLYFQVTRALGFKPLRHEGKVLGLAAFGKPIFADELRRHYTIADDGQIKCRVRISDIAAQVDGLAARASREDVAASVQAVLEDVTIESLKRIAGRAPARHLGLSGGVFANVKLTQRIAEALPFSEIFVCPAMSDQGEAEGGALQFLLQRDGLDAWLGHRQRFGNLYFGRDYMASADAIFRDAGMKSSGTDNPALRAAEIMAEGGIVGTYLGRCEYGPRALGARSIMARPNDRAINDWLNKRLDRTEFMPFAPVVRAERADDIFILSPSLRYTSRFMTVTCDVRAEWREKIPAVVHVDGTARPQLIRREDNATYYDALANFERLTGTPVLINTSFNVHEEPIINRPVEALRALEQGRVDHLLTDKAVWSRC